MANRANLRDQRLQHLKTILLWEGELSNKRIRELFGLKNVQASRLIAEFKEAFPEAYLEEKSRRGVLTSRLETKKGLGLEDYLNLVANLPNGLEGIEDARVSLDIVDPAIFALMRQASINQLAVEIVYASMSTTHPTSRIVIPHHLVRAGRRWHARAWCVNHNEYRDFTLGRIHQAALNLGALTLGLPQDIAWETIVDIHLKAHRDLTADQEHVIRQEYFPGAAGRRIETRACLVPYVLQELGAATDPTIQKPPVYQLEVGNVKEIKAWMW